MLVGMDRAEISRIAHRDHPIAAPLTAERVREVVALLSTPTGGAVLDIGCGQGEWLLELLAARTDLTGVGVDIATGALAEAERHASSRGVSHRVRWVEADGSTWSGGLFDAVVCVGVSHVFGGLDGTLRALRSHLLPGGQVLLGDGIWEVSPPTEAAQDALDAAPEEFPDIAGLVDRVREQGFEVGPGHVSTVEEWDDYEWSWTGSLVRWALQEATNDEDRQQALTEARAHRKAWLAGYRRQLGFATLLLYDVTAGLEGASR